MGTVDKQGVVKLQELLVSSLAQTDALAKLLSSWCRSLSRLTRRGGVIEQC